MSSTSKNRSSGAGSSAARSNRFGDYTIPVGRPNEEDKTSQGSTFSTIRSNGWQNSSGIWGNSTYGSGLTNSKGDTSRSRVEDEGEYTGTGGSSALAASSEALWSSRTWPVDKTSPTMSTSGSASPERHRGNGPLLLPQTSPYLTTSRTSVGQGSCLNNSRSPGKSNLDPDSSPFKYPIQKAPYGFTDDKENMGQVNSIGHGIDSYGFERTWRSNSNASRDNSGPPSRHSDSGSSGFANGSYLGNGQYSSHPPNNSVQVQRPLTQGRAASFASSSLNGRSYNDLNDQLAELNLGFSRSKESYLSSSVEHPYLQSSEYPSLSLPQSQPASVSIWPAGIGSSSRALNGYLSDNPTDSAFSDQQNPTKPFGFNERAPGSPEINYRNQQNRLGYYSTIEKPSAELEHAASRHHGPQSFTELQRELHRHQFAPRPQYFPPPHVVYNSSQFQGQYQPQAYDFSPHHNFHINHQPHGYQMPQSSYTSALPPRGPARDQDFGGFVLRSQLLEEFRVSSKTNRRYELKDIYKHVVEFSGDQHGSRFIQQKLETANSDEKDQIFREIQPNALQLMTDVFGNYVIQKFFEHGNQVQKRILAEHMKNHVNDLSVQMYGCRVVQKALEHVLADQQAELVKELQHDILKCVKDQNGNHVIQKAIERVPTEHIQFIIEAFKGQVHTLATHLYGCRVIQRMLEYCTEKDQAAVLAELHACAHTLITDQYGNYVMQHVIEHGKPEDKAKIIELVTQQLLHLSKHKFASNVVEKTIQFGSDQQRRAIVAELTATSSDGNSPLQLMMKDQYGNYVIQKLLAQLKGVERERFVEEMRPHLNVLKKYNYGKQITAIEKLISNGLPTQTPPMEINSPAATPILTMEQNSPESSSLPSTNASTVDGPTHPSSTKTVVAEKALPELNFESIQ